MRALVTGVAGFVGSNLAARLLADGHDVRGVDCFTPYYDERLKRANVATLAGSDRFDLVEQDLLEADADGLLAGIDVVFHQAGQPGVRLSWSDGFDRYDAHNIRATQRLLEGATRSSISRFVLASSSSVYGNAPAYPTTEDDLPRPHSPYGVTKLAAEHLCGLYAEVHGVPSIALRYFTVYGPAQRPDMLMHRLIESALTGGSVPLFGDGTQVREFTHVDDVIAANLAASSVDVAPGTVVNIAGGSEVSVREVVDLVGEIVGADVVLDPQSAKPGDVLRTGASIERARAVLDWSPRVDLRTGLTSQVAWHRAWLGLDPAVADRRTG